MKKISLKYADTSKANKAETIDDSSTKESRTGTHEIIFNNFDGFFDSNIKSTEKPTNLDALIVCIENVVQSSKPVQNNPSELLNIVLKILSKLTDLIDEMQSLKIELFDNMNFLCRQICRLELKSAGVGINLNGNVSSNNIECMEGTTPDDFLNLPATLAAEGLPVGACVETNELELRLRSDAAYRTRLV